jgi:hypothetical protein
LGRAPFGYFLSLGLKKYHSCSPKVALPKKKPRIKKQRKKKNRTISHVKNRFKISYAKQVTEKFGKWV